MRMSLNACQNVIALRPKTSGIVMFQSHWRKAGTTKTRRIMIGIRKKRAGPGRLLSMGLGVG
jgi:hypothetical protein